jgi:hypothetical protein
MWQGLKLSTDGGESPFMIYHTGSLDAETGVAENGTPLPMDNPHFPHSMDIFRYCISYFSNEPKGQVFFLVGGLEHFLFFNILGISSSQLTNSYFSEG